MCWCRTYSKGIVLQNHSLKCLRKWNYWQTLKLIGTRNWLSSSLYNSPQQSQTFGWTIQRESKYRQSSHGDKNDWKQRKNETTDWQIEVISLTSLSHPSHWSLVIWSFSRESEERIRVIELEKNESNNQLQDLKGKYHRIQDQNKEYEREIEDLSLQLTLSLEARENMTRTFPSKPKRIMKSLRPSPTEEIDLEELEPNGSEDEEEINHIMNDISSGD